MTLGELIQRYIDTVSVHKKGHAQEKAWLNALLRHPICSKDVADITTGHWTENKNERLKQVKPQSLKRQIAVVSHVYKVASEQWGHAIVNPLDKLQLKAPSVSRNRVLQEGEHELIIAGLQRCQNPLMLAVYLFAMETASRRSEILGATWKNLDIRKRTLLLPDTKNGEKRIVPLSIQAIAILESIDPSTSTDDRIFSICDNTYKNTWAKVKRKLGVKDLRFHDTRHFATSNWASLGWSIPKLAAMTGHKDWKMLQRPWFVILYSEREWLEG